MTRNFLITLGALLVLVVPSAAQDICGIYSLTATPQQSNGTLALTVTAYSDCQDASTSVTLTLTGPNGTPRSSGSGSGTRYATAQASISTTNLAGQAQYSGTADTRGTCWASGYSGGSYSYNGSVRLNDPTPSIATVSPGAWEAGMTNYPVTITGTNFGAMPTLTIDPSAGISFSYASRSDQQMIVNVSVAENTPVESVTLTVTSTGYNGSGFVSTGGNPPQSLNKTVDITSTLFAVYGFDIAVLGPVTGVSNQTNSVVSGQGFPIRVTAKTYGGTVATRYTGKIHFSSTDPGASLPSDYTFTSFDNGIHDFSNAVLKTVNGNSPTRDITVSDSSVSVSGTQNVFVWFNVIASQEGLVGGTTSSGHVITSEDHFVALPTGGALNASVMLLYAGTTQETTVLDKGPWCPHSSPTTHNPCVCGDDNYWRSSGTPWVITTTCDSDNAGIDLADGTFHYFGLSGNAPIYWRFK